MYPSSDYGYPNMAIDHITIPYMEGHEDGVSIIFINATFKMKDGLVKKYPHPIFGEWLITEIFEKIKIFADKKGVFKKQYLCSACGNVLDPFSSRLMQPEYTIRFKELPPFTIRFRFPAVECSRCRKICGIDIDGKVGFNVAEAIIHAFQSESIQP
jgi:hypothetical protein